MWDSIILGTVMLLGGCMGVLVVWLNNVEAKKPK